MAYAYNLKEHILSISKQLAQTHGISNINIRQVASETGISLGTIYNYYPSKGDLIAAVVEDFWEYAFKGLDAKALADMGALEGLEKAYFALLDYLNSFNTDWLSELSMLKFEDKQVSREREKEYLGNVLVFVERILASDNSFSKGKSDADLKQLSLFVYDNLIAMLKRGDKDFEFFKNILSKMKTN